MDIIELRMMGGLGNQLYQYSAARYQYKKYNAKQIVIDIGEFETYKTRNLEIDKLLHNSDVIIKPVQSTKSSIYRMSYHLYQKLYRMIKKQRASQWVLGNSKDKYLCAYVEYNPLSKLDTKVLHMYGYFVSSEIALSVRDELMHELYLENSSMSEKCLQYLQSVDEKNTIGVSIRCADDYVNNNWPICSKDYYRKGIDYILNLQGNREKKILIFADRIDKVKNEKWFSDYENITFVENVTVCESFELLRHCTDYVLSNSSFSWWGAFLSYSKDAIKINPNKVYSGNSNKEDQLTFYDELILMDYITGEKV